MNDESVIFVGGVKACFTHQEISDYFSQFGKVSSIKMKKHVLLLPVANVLMQGSRVKARKKPSRRPKPP